MRAIGKIGVSLAFLIAAPALADPPTAYESLHFPDTPEMELKSPPLGALAAGDLPIILEKTTLKRLQQRFGGGLHRGGDAADSVTWICYDKPVRQGAWLVYWFMSNNEMGGGTHITQVAVQRTAATPDARCDPAPARLTGVSFGLPSIGARLGDVQRRFGGGQPAGGYLSYGNTRSMGSAGDPDTTASQTVVYHVTDGAIDAVSVSQVTAD